MAVPKRKNSKQRRNKRGANKGIKATSFSICKNCKYVISPHTVCKSCGFYDGKKYVDTKIDRAIKRNSERRAYMDKVKSRNEKLGKDKQQQNSEAIDIDSIEKEMNEKNTKK